MNRNEVTEMLKKYRTYKFAIRNFEKTGWVSMTGTQWSDMPRGGGFGSRAPVKFASDSLQDVADYNEYKRTIELVDGALDELRDEERSVVCLKWMDDMTLQQIADRKRYSKETIKRYHRKGLTKLCNCLRFVELPEIEYLPVA